MTDGTKELRDWLGSINDLYSAAGLLEWDQRTMMPPAASDVRAHQLGTLASLAHERFTSRHTRQLLDAAANASANSAASDDDAAIVRVITRDWERQEKVPAELAAAITEAGATGYRTWIEAKQNRDFQQFLPALRNMVELKRRYIDCFAVADSPYDQLIEDYEPGLTAADITPVFESIKTALTPLVANLDAAVAEADGKLLEGEFSDADQQRLQLLILPEVGYASDRYRLDLTVHPFASSAATTDVRLTTRYLPDSLGSGIYSSLHEFGHGLYEAQIDPALNRTLLAHGCSLSLHESQSRFWENLVGRSKAYMTVLLTHLLEVFPERFQSTDVDQLYRAVNGMRPSLIRIEADELTYGFHIILRFELERDIFEGRLKLEDLPEAWNARMKEYLGVEVPHDGVGVLQDVHWSSGGFGYFPTYLLGSVLAVQIFSRMKADSPNIEDQIAVADFEPMRDWLRVNLHRHGRKFTPKETIRLATGGDIDPLPYIDYLTAKVNGLYGS